MGYQLGKWFYYSGAIHIHTTESDGTLPIDAVVALGQEVGLDYMMFTDHMTLSNQAAGQEGFWGKTLVLIGYEHNDLKDNNHYMIFESPRVYPSDMTAKEYVSAASKDGALGIMAHPDEIRTDLRNYRSYPWLDWSVEGFQGIEMWNQMSEWMEQLTPFNKVAMAFSPRKSMVGPTERLLKKWDELNVDRKVAGLASVDAHAFPIRVWPFTVPIFPYKVHFKSLRTHLILTEPLSNDFETAKKQVYDAIRDCRLYFSNLRWGNAERFEFYAQNDDHQVVAGGDLVLTKDTHLTVRLPARARLKIIGNGRQLAETTTDSMEYPVREPGQYRVEAWRGRRGWIFSNHIRVKSAGEGGTS